ncbi:MAG: FixH family protein [Azoarcus sp.]|jgi:hypothetical protein|nr:FixH family protein [Azoarcus sp.]
MAIDSQAVVKVVNQPGYKQGWPWFLFGLPALSVVIGVTLYCIANVWNLDSIVAGDYAKNGKGVELLINRQKRAQELGLSAQATVDGNVISVKFSAEKDLPEVLRLDIFHPTQDRFDQHALLQKGENGLYSSPIKPLHGSLWQFQLEDEPRVWRMTGYAYIQTDGAADVSITPFPVKPRRPDQVDQAESIRPSGS